MDWIWWSIAGILVAGMLFLFGSNIQLRIRFTRLEGDDHLTFDVRGLYGLIRLRFAVPMIVWDEHGINLTAKTINRLNRELLSGQNMSITRDKIEQFFRRMKELLAHTYEMFRWTRGLLSRIECTELSWVTRIGLDDAADTAITVGVVWGLKTSLLAFLFRYIRLAAVPSLSVQPQFNRVFFSTEAVCTARMKVFYALYAFVMLLYRIMGSEGGLRTWRKAMFRPT